MPAMPVGRGLALAGSLLLMAGLYASWIAVPRVVAPGRSLQEFPLVVEGWTGEESTWVRGAQFFPGADAELTRTYRAAPRRAVHLYIGYFGVQRQGKALVNFHVRALHDAAQMVGVEAGPGGIQPMNLSRAKIGGEPYAVLFWYRYPGHEVAGRFQAKAMGIFNALFRRRSDGAVVLLGVPPDGGRDPGGDLREFARAVVPLLRTVVP
jgi:EpsI family protein